MSGKSVLKRVDWLTVLFYLLLVTIGWVNIYSSTFSESDSSIFDFGTLHGKQLFFIGASLASIVILLALEANFYERFSSLMYLISMVLLLGLFVFGKTIAGATSWYNLGFFNLQPSELAKVATAMALAKYLSDIQTDIKRRKDQLYAFGIILLPALLIIPQPDPGSALVFFSLSFVIFREGLPLYYLGIALLAILTFVTTLMFGTIWVVIFIALLLVLFFLLKNKKFKVPVFSLSLAVVVTILFSLSVNFVFNNVFEQRHRDRFSLWLRLEKDPGKLEQIRKTIGYNTYQSEKAIESGGFFGKGFLEGTRTKGDFVPEQHTDYIFSTVGEEWGFLGTSTVVVLFTLLLLRLVYLAERQKTDFSRMYGYGVVSILLIHYFINIGMVIGVLPTIGIPLPFFSYGGSGLLFFTILLFIFLKLDANRLKEGI
ncbi:rod shape-determining protein RodA [Euzebyella marina]|uniref:Rod shape-determining protein RodA n=1 Tax=Euzebyella marina TaxID=1761453 RepID=A0A3G2LA52_9FLAO|nr:rod shape-determining protein RodA [Euzebyella marina]AYN69136.1 rod shape-determining protein RodA [Euzebyella marina]MAU71785.1 rod shape-determining protein RodA [Pseudozobellia sp.]MBG50049.1 rod shape-determining protein RodA [Pseudozobellia sp.]|tara:strand:- start:663 stop:1946 length:1284 start_codon:yes stop_codon:yes gene_type:complete